MSDRDDIPIRLYRPANGSEGLCFQAQFCDRCVKDRGFPDDDKEDGWCPLIANALAYDITDPKYPQQWVLVGDEPQCTAFVEDVGQKWPPEATAYELEAAGQGRLIP
jgi:hypothetical protein